MVGFRHFFPNRIICTHNYIQMKYFTVCSCRAVVVFSALAKRIILHGHENVWVNRKEMAIDEFKHPNNPDTCERCWVQLHSAQNKRTQATEQLLFHSSLYGKAVNVSPLFSLAKSNLRKKATQFSFHQKKEISDFVSPSNKLEISSSICKYVIT